MVNVDNKNSLEFRESKGLSNTKQILFFVTASMQKQLASRM